MGCYVVQFSGWLPTFRDNISVPFSRVKESKTNVLGLADHRIRV
jgi:hypothetical protein